MTTILMPRRVSCAADACTWEGCIIGRMAAPTGWGVDPWGRVYCPTHTRCVKDRVEQDQAQSPALTAPHVPCGSWHTSGSGMHMCALDDTHTGSHECRCGEVWQSW